MCEPPEKMPAGCGKRGKFSGNIFGGKMRTPSEQCVARWFLGDRLGKGYFSSAQREHTWTRRWRTKVNVVSELWPVECESLCGVPSSRPRSAYNLPRVPPS